MLFSIYYKIEHRSEFLNKFIDKSLKTIEDDDRDNTTERLTDLMELMVNMLINQDKYGLFELLTKKNSKNVRVFFNYLTCSNIRSINKDIVKNRINEIFK
jgi:predicted house-cleaning noncanonical NTP pyrophosphatase (MazG superfamily)